MKYKQHIGFIAALRLLLFGIVSMMMSNAAWAAAADVPDEACNMALIYGITAALSLLLVIGYCVLIKRKGIWFLFLLISVLVVNLGYFTMSISNTLGEAMLANRIAYLGSVFLPLCMLMIILNLCELKPGKLAIGVLIGISVLIFLVAASGGYLKLYYKEVSLEIVHGSAKLHKVYGPLHSLYFIYLFAYLAAMVGVIAYAAIKKRGRLRKFAPIMCTVVLLNMAIWFVEQQINWEFEFLSVSYIVSALLLLLLQNTLPEPAPAPKPAVDPYVVCPQLADLTKREMDVLKLILANKKRKEIAEELFVTENTVKKHTAHIYEKLEICDRSELLLKLGGTEL